MTRTVELTEGVEWISTCLDVDAGHAHGSVYLLSGGNENEGEGTVLVDAGSPDDSGIPSTVDRLAGGGSVDAIVLTHTNLPHTGNIGRFRDEDTRVISATSIPAEFGDYGEAWKIDETAEVAGRRLSFIKPPMTDHVFSMWVFDHGSGTLFMSEALGNYHAPGRCADVLDGDAEPIPRGMIDAFCRERLPWLQYVNPDRLRSVLDDRIPDDVEYLAPIHGNPVGAARVDAYLDQFVDVAAGIADDWPLGAAAGDR